MINPLLHQRLRNQQLAQPHHSAPADVVRRLGAVQSQDYLGALWAIGLRLLDATEASVAQAVDDGLVLRTHVLRPTWHFVAPEDLRWMLALTAPRIIAGNAHRYRQLDIDDALVARSNTIIAQALERGQQTRTELADALERDGIATNVERLTHLVMRAELDGIICSGARRGKQFTYALLDERAPAAPPRDRDAALAALTERYFAGHGPATAQDFAWWAGLTLADVQRGLELAQPPLASHTIDGQTYWFAPTEQPAPEVAPAAYLLPNYDEYMVGYTDRSACCTEIDLQPAKPRENIVFNNTIVIDGQIVGTWKRTLRRREVVVELTRLRSLTEAEEQAVMAATQRYGAFLGLQVVFA